MNIFVLDPNPIIAASYHCDQHLHKMVLESAQLLSTAAHIHFPHLSPYIYAPSYQKHPCNIWIRESYSHMAWVCSLAIALDSIRQTNGSTEHSSIRVIKAVQDNIPTDSPMPTYFAEAMYAHIKIRPDLGTVGKYRLYYRKKSIAWGSTERRMMMYKGRSVPDFMEGFTE